MTAVHVRGILLAAGAGRRMGGPKALLRDASGTPAVLRGVSVLRDGGCTAVTVVVGAAADDVRAVLAGCPPDVDVVEAEDWAQGMGASLRVGLDTASGPAGDAAPGSADDGDDGDDGVDGAVGAAVVLLVDLPDVGPAVVRRLLSEAAPGPAALARAAYGGRPGHPVLIGRDHWAGVGDRAGGDRGARDYLADHPPVLVECGDLATGRDTDTPADLPG